MRKLIFLFIVLLLASPGYAATYYMATTGNNSNDGSSGSPWLTLQYAHSQMRGGDTLVIKPGTYGGTGNVTTNASRPPNGEPGAYTIIKAETDGTVIISGENTRNIMSLSGTSGANISYIQYEGIIWGYTDYEGHAASLVLVYYCNHIKFLRCGAVDNHAGEDSHVFSVYFSSYILFEGCYVWGQGDYPFIFGHGAEKCIARECVARIDRQLANETGTGLFGYVVYGARQIEFQNNIFIDNDQAAYYIYEGGSPSYIAAIMMRWDGPAGFDNSDIYFRGHMSINGQQGVAGDWPTETTSVHLVNCVHWGGANGNRVRHGGIDFDHCTFGNITGTGTSSRGIYWEDAFLATADNTIITGVVSNYGTVNGSTRYCSYYNNQTNYSGTGDRTGNIYDVDPLAASLRYLVRIEDGSPLKGAAEDGGDIGATILYRIGVAESLWGDSGYNATRSPGNEYATDQVNGDSLWPFPNEDLIKTKFASYSYDSGGVVISGARGFAHATNKQLNGTDDVTLTSYIWEYLGNQIPSDIYGSPSTPSLHGVSLHGVDMR